MGLKELLKIPLSIRPLSRAKNNYIVTYHDISPPGDPSYSKFYSTSPERFQTQVNFFSKYFELVSLGEIVEEKASRRPRLAISFDDGFISVKKTAWPILRAAGAPFTVFVNRVAIETGSLDYGIGYSQLKVAPGVSSPYMSLTDIREMLNAGVDFGSHGASHCILSECTEVELLSEIKGNADFLRANLKVEVPFLAFPFGKKKHYSQQVVASALAAGHKFLFSSNPSHFVTSNDVVKPRISLLEEDERQLSFLFNRSLFKDIDL